MNSLQDGHSRPVHQSVLWCVSIIFIPSLLLSSASMASQPDQEEQSGIRESDTQRVADESLIWHACADYILLRKIDAQLGFREFVDANHVDAVTVNGMSVSISEITVTSYLDVSSSLSKHNHLMYRYISFEAPNGYEWAVIYPQADIDINLTAQEWSSIAMVLYFNWQQDSLYYTRKTLAKDSSVQGLLLAKNEFADYFDIEVWRGAFEALESSVDFIPLDTSLIVCFNYYPGKHDLRVIPVPDALLGFPVSYLSENTRGETTIKMIEDWPGKIQLWVLCGDSVIVRSKTP